MEEGRTTLIGVLDEMGLGRLDVRATDGGRHEVEVMDSEGDVVATGRSGFYVDLPAGRYRATMEDRTVDVEIAEGQDTVINPDDWPYAVAATEVIGRADR